MSNKKDSTLRTFLVAFITCAVCAVFVSTAAILLRPVQEKNQELFKNKNILLACGLLEKGEVISAEECAKRLEQVTVLKIDLALGTVVATGDEAKKYDERTAAKTAGEFVKTAGSEFKVGIPTRGKFGTIYSTKDRVVIPIVGKGLWSVMSGFLALDAKGEKVQCILFYDQAETAGLGGEIENVNWQKGWEGKTAFEGDRPVVHVIKGTAPKDSATEVDGISGATLTGNGVNGTVGYWLQQYRPYLKTLAIEGGNVQ